MRRRTSLVVLTALAALAATTVSVAGRPAPAAAAAVPSGFRDDPVATLGGATAVEWLPNDRIAVLEQDGRVRVARPGGAFTTALTLDVCSQGERGLLGIAPDPAFLGNGFVYVYSTRPAPDAPGGCVNRVSRFTMHGDTIDPASELVLLDRISSVNTNHNGGDLDVGSDGHLYVAVGDAGRDPRGDSGSAGANDAAQDRSLLNGKILRITRDGRPAPGNPLTGPGTTRCAMRGNTPATPTSLCQEIYAWGLRNPFRFAFDRNDGSSRFFVNDVGQRTFEEVNRGAVGTNYGWPLREGPCAQGATPPCAPAPAGYTDPITAYPRSLGTFVTAGAFTPNGLWPEAYDGTYLFADGGSGTIWTMRPDGSVDYDDPFATGAFGIVDMTFGFDTAGRMVLYYVTSGGAVRAISPTAPLPSTTSSGLRMVPIAPRRVYDTQDGVGAAAGDVFNGTTRVIDLDPPAGSEAALVNLTYAATAGPGFLRAWGTRAGRPPTSSVNADRAGSFVANAAVVPLAADGTFVLEATTTGRVIVDVMAWFQPTGGSSAAGRFVAIDPIRVVDTRLANGTRLESGSTNPWTRTADRIDVDVVGHVDVPADGTVDAVVVSVGAIAGDGPGGFVGAFPGGGSYSGTSNVNVLRGDIRANMMVVPLAGASHISLRTLNIADVVVDVLGYVTSPAAPVSVSGLYGAIDPVRVVDTPLADPFGRMEPLVTRGFTTPRAGTTSGVVQNVTVTAPAAPGWVAAHTSAGDVPAVSTVNFTAADQTRAAAAFTRVRTDGREHVTSLVAADVIVDVVGVFSR